MLQIHGALNTPIKITPAKTLNILQVEQWHLDVGGIGNDVVVAAAGPQNEIEEPHSSWQVLPRLANVTIGEAMKFLALYKSILWLQCDQ